MTTVGWDVDVLISSQHRGLLENMILECHHKNFLGKNSGCTIFIWFTMKVVSGWPPWHSSIKLKEYALCGLLVCVVHQPDLATSRRQERLTFNTSGWCTLHTFFFWLKTMVGICHHTGHQVHYRLDYENAKWLVYLDIFCAKIRCNRDRKYIGQVGLFGLRFTHFFLVCHEYLSERYTQYVV